MRLVNMRKVSLVFQHFLKKELKSYNGFQRLFKGMEINVLSETIPTHTYKSKTLTKAFEEITGIKVNHQLLGEGEVVQAVQTQMQTGRNLYDHQ